MDFLDQSSGLAPLSLDHVQVAAPPGCEHEARAFYGGVLGLPELAKPPALRDRGGAWFALAGGELHVGVVDTDPTHPFVPAAKAHPGLRVADAAALDVLAARLRAAGAAVIWDDAVCGMRRFYTADPWGNRLELLA